ncbi:hypothetical protein Lalb_Chr09g0321371 [Lupinus albus]|uniref:Uncharacterized protein n=1 Tax=Lupinus albus TaxID=3870 RepID=A0A6A4PZB1_LUPAL|nr:hypothetical protein Lalb_Chr09g0321371 [Lupinus albus]
MFPILYLSAGTCTTLIIIGGTTARTFYEVVCGDACGSVKPMTTTEWYWCLLVQLLCYHSCQTRILLLEFLWLELLLL